MPELPRTHLVLYGLAALAVLAFGVRQVAGAHAHDKAAAAPPIALDRDSGAAGGGSRIVVHVAGAVARPGVYRLHAGARVDDAVRRAGGPR
ncbi:MAG: competence protein ComEA, partial [Solirubrobacteraceae bacterium]|nr:competence protein ComEA [Solirubrobacteraceae bacterium]